MVTHICWLDGSVHGAVGWRWAMLGKTPGMCPCLHFSLLTESICSAQWDSVSTQGQRSFLHIWLRPTESLPFPGRVASSSVTSGDGQKCLDSSQNDFYLWMLFQFHQGPPYHVLNDMSKFAVDENDDGENHLWPLKIGHVLWGKSLGTERGIVVRVQRWLEIWKSLTLALWK